MGDEGIIRYLRIGSQMKGDTNRKKQVQIQSPEETKDTEFKKFPSDILLGRQCKEKPAKGKGAIREYERILGVKNVIALRMPCGRTRSKQNKRKITEELGNKVQPRRAVKGDPRKQLCNLPGEQLVPSGAEVWVGQKGEI